MKNKIAKVLGTVVLLTMVLVQSVFASGVNKITYLPKNSVMMQSAVCVVRSCLKDYMTVSQISVYPVSGTDNYTQCYFRMYSSTEANTPVSSKALVTEGNAYNIYFYSTFDAPLFDICVAGHAPSLDGYVAYHYSGN